ncbi:MAG: beta-galactosidase, partial [Hominenteromicrobium sp.]
IPYWVSEKYPDALPVSFHNETRVCNTLDYLHEGYLSACRSWYRAVMKIIVPRLQSNGGNIIGVQLDNEIGMLNWVTNFPVMNDSVLRRFSAWLQKTYSSDALRGRYPFDISAAPAVFQRFRNPEAEWEVAFHFDFGRFLRDYYAEYVSVLRGFAVECGVQGVPFFLNIHGTGSGRIFDFPLGVSQLYKAYNQCGDIISGTDVYLGEPKAGNYQDMYVCNTVTDAMNHGGRPLTSIEFQCSDGPYCSLDGMRDHPTAPAHQLLLCLSQNARMISFYVFSGGENYPLRYPRGDGDDRMAFTGQLHGLNAPVQPDGSRNYAFAPISRAARAIHALAPLTASAAQKCDDLIMAYLPDYFLTELCDPMGSAIKTIQDNLRRLRCAGAIDAAACGILGTGCRFSGMEIHEALEQTGKAVFLLSARYMAKETQEKLLHFAEQGGRLLMYGELPRFDLEGAPCTVLCDGLGLSDPVYEEENMPRHFISFRGVGPCGGLVTDLPGTRAQNFAKNGCQWLSTVGEPDGMCAFGRTVGRGRVLAVTCDYPAQQDFWRKALDFLGVTPAVAHNETRGGVYVSRSCSEDGQEFFVILNLDAQEKTVDISVDGEIVFPALFLTEKRGMLLPRHVEIGCGEIELSTAEFLGEEPDALHFGLTQKSDTIILNTARKLRPQPGVTVCSESGKTVIHIEKDARVTPEIVLTLEKEEVIE